VAHVLAFIPDLLFGSRVKASLEAAGNEVELISEPREDGDVLIVDLTAEAEQRIAQVAPRANVIGFYSHVEHEVRERALQAGFDVVIPRSRMAREGPAVVQRLLAAD
jgi:DNA-binding NarL/FixJ family response regulator